ncbi:MAG: nicotinamide riboside transporter PnuC [Candidatus Berkiellales bacterium]
MNWLDFAGAGMSLVCTYYFTQAKRLAWLLGMIAVLLNGLLYWSTGIYGALLLEIVLLFTMIYGWYHWSENKKALPIRSLTFNEGIAYGFIVVLTTWIMAQGLMLWTDSEIPYWDATVTTLGLMAQWLLCLKIIHCWILWFIVDALAASLQLYKGIPFHSAMQCLYLILAVVGYLRWRKLTPVASLA